MQKKETTEGQQVVLECYNEFVSIYQKMPSAKIIAEALGANEANVYMKIEALRRKKLIK